MKKIFFTAFTLISICGLAQYDTLNYNFTYPTSTLGKVSYYNSPPSIIEGFIFGTNNKNDKEKAQFFDIAGSSKNRISKIWINFAQADTMNGISAAGKFIRVKIYDQDSASLLPMNVLATSDKIYLRDIINDVAAGKMTEVAFQSPVQVPVSVPSIKSNAFYVSVALSGDPLAGGNLDWNSDHDSLSIFSNLDSPSATPNVWNMFSDDTWCKYNNNCGVGKVSVVIRTSLWIFPFMEDQTAGLENVDKDFGITVFPNPAKEVVNIRSLSKMNGKAVVNVVNVLGQIVFSKVVVLANESVNLSINTTGIPAGSYILQVVGERTIMNKSLIIQ